MNRKKRAMSQEERPSDDRHPLTESKLQALLSKQTAVILEAVDQRLVTQAKRIDAHLTSPRQAH